MRKSSVVFFLSGAAALAYEAIWARLLARVLGSDAGATAIVLSVFMAGLGLGALGAARIARVSVRPERAYAALEAFIGAWAALSPCLLTALEPVDGFASRAWVAAACLLPPTLAMGATFPLMGRLTIESAAATGLESSRFYGVNTFGAAAGALFAPILLMPMLGLRLGLLGAAAASGCAAALALALRPPPRADSAREEGTRFRLDPFLLVPAAFGASSLALEVVLTRVVVTVTGASIYAFAIVLAVFLVGLAFGSSLARDALARGRTALRCLAGCAFAAPIAALAGVLFLRWKLGEPDLFASLSNRTLAADSPLLLWASHTLFAALVLLPPAVAFGAALPLCIAVGVERSPGHGPERVLGRVYAANTLGALFGALIAGFVLLPMFGLRTSFGLALAPCVLAGLCTPRTPRTLAALALAATVVIGAWALRPADRGGNSRVLFHRTGRFEAVAVEESLEQDGGRVRSIRLNGKVEASTAPVDVRLQRLLAYLPGLLHGEVRSALVIGAGSGMTAGSLLDLPALERLTLIEIELAVLPATELFAEWNNDLIHDPRVAVRVADGRHALARSPERFDLITADPIHPWSRGSSDLYTLEYFGLMSRHLAPGGVAAQWLPLYELSTRDVHTIAATWCAAFPHAQAYLTAYDLALIGANDPLQHSLEQVELPPAVARRLAEVGLHSGTELAALCVAFDADLRAWVAGVEPMRDDLPVIEFRAPLAFLRGYSEEALRWCARPEFVERLPASVRGRAREVRALLLDFLERLPSGKSVAAARYGRALLALPPVR